MPHEAPALDLRKRLVVDASAASDLVLRTALASAVAVLAAPWTLSSAPSRERRRLPFYEQLAQRADAASVFPRPPKVEVAVAPAPGRWMFRPRDGRVDLLHFASPFVTLNPAVRDDYARFERNRVAWAQHWRHDDGPRPTLCVIHGFAGSPYWFNSIFFALPWLYTRGYDVLLYTMPFHGARAAFTPLNGSELFAHGVAHFNEAIAHAVHDFRVFVDHLERSGVEHVALTGLSLGGYMSALLAAIEDRLDVVIPNAAVTDIPRLVRQWFPANLGVWLGCKRNGLSVQEVSAALQFHSPLHYPSVVARENLMIIGGLGDRLAPPEQSRVLWEHWGRPRLHWYPGSHVLHVERRAYLQELPKFLRAAGFHLDADAAEDAASA